jgi:hypothetical protein
MRLLQYFIGNALPEDLPYDSLDEMFFTLAMLFLSKSL